MKRSWCAISLVILAMLALGACSGDGSSSRGAAALGKDADGVAYVGADNCLECHAGFSWSSDVAFFRKSKHVLHSTEISAGDDPECLECHSPVGDAMVLEGMLDPSAVPADGLAAITCEACHGAGGWEHSATEPAVRQLPDDQTCTESCHIDGQTTTYPEVEDGPAGTCVPGGGAFDPGEIIYDTHFKATAGDWSEGDNLNDITGAVMDEFEGRVCLNCHNPHLADASINREWDASKHADKTAGGAWAHYNWTHDGSGDLSNWTFCQKCKTTTGIIAYVDAIRNGTEYTAPLALQEEFKPEMLLCYGCHTDNKGTVRNPGPMTADYADATGADATFKDIDDSNICLVCHAGRSNGQAIKDADFAEDITGSNFGSFNSHYLAAAGVLYRKVGYEFTGQDYANPFFYRHDTIGTPQSTSGGGDPVDTGARGPCVECHMQTMAGGLPNHRYSALKLNDPTDPESEPVGLLPFCGTCHNTTDPQGRFFFDFAVLQHEEESFEEALEVLAERLAAAGIYYGDGFPYFFADPEVQHFGTAYTDWPNKDTLGAAFNLNLLHHEPGAFAHNRFYTKRLIFDAIDFLDNGTLDGTITVDAAKHPDAAIWLDGDDEVEGIQRP